MVKLSSIRVNPSNPRLIKDNKFKELCNNIKSLPKMMALRPIVVYCWHADRHAREVAQNIEDSGFVIINQIIWAKNNIVIGRGDYHWKHEPCWYAVRKGSKHSWQGSRKETTLWEIDKPMKSETGHSTQKPVECMARPIRNNSYERESVYDPFLGSGTTMVAAHQLNRKCYGMEIDPKYCQVIIDRMQKLDSTIEIKKNGSLYVRGDVAAQETVIKL